MKVGLAQLEPVWLNRDATLDKVVAAIEQAAAGSCALVVFGEALVPGYPFWLEHTGAAAFNDVQQKRWFAHYAAQAVVIEAGHLQAVCAAAARHRIAVVLGIVERPADRAGHSLYCSLVYVASDGAIASVHRKLMPTYEERLVWAIGDGAGLVAHVLGAFTVGALNCWENWMPLARSALYAQGVDVHCAIWPGNVRNTKDLTRFIALESRSYVVSVSGLMRRAGVGDELPQADLLRAAMPDVLADGGSCAAAPDGSWLLAPVADREGVFTVELDPQRVREERQNFDPSGHYSRPDVLRLNVRRSRDRAVRFDEDGEA